MTDSFTAGADLRLPRPRPCPGFPRVNRARARSCTGYRMEAKSVDGNPVPGLGFIPDMLLGVPKLCELDCAGKATPDIQSVRYRMSQGLSCLRYAAFICIAPAANAPLIPPAESSLHPRSGEPVAKPQTTGWAALPEARIVQAPVGVGVLERLVVLGIVPGASCRSRPAPWGPRRRQGARRSRRDSHY